GSQDAADERGRIPSPPCASCRPRRLCRLTWILLRVRPQWWTDTLLAYRTRRTGTISSDATGQRASRYFRLVNTRSPATLNCSGYLETSTITFNWPAIYPKA